MTRVFYGGKPGALPGDPGMIELEIVNTMVCSRRPVMDGPTRLYDEIQYECVAIFNPRATSYQQAGIGVDPASVKGRMAYQTDTDISGRLTEPRRQLIIMIGDTPWIVSPNSALGRNIDAANGPQPYRFEVLQIPGDKTFIVRWGVKTWVNTCTREAAAPAAVLSHRWKSERATDVDSLSTLTTFGHAIFDTAVMDSLTRIPDSYWDSFAPPMPENFRRESIQVVASEDGSALQYCVVDRETPMSIATRGRGISRIECYHAASVARGSLFEVAKGGLKGAAAGAAAGAGIGSKFGVYGTVAGGLIGGIGGFVFGAGEKAIAMMEHAITARIWGSRYAKKVDLEAGARKIIAQRLVEVGIGAVARSFAGYSTSIVHDVAGRFVECVGRFYVPTIMSAAYAIEKKLGFGELLWPNMPDEDEVVTLVDGVTESFFKNEGKNPPIIRGLVDRGGTRGSYLGSVVAQALVRACSRQPDPVTVRSRRAVGDGAGPLSDFDDRRGRAT